MPGGTEAAGRLGWRLWGGLTRFVNCVSIMKLCTCFSALVSSSFRATTATTSAVHPAPCERDRVKGLQGCSRQGDPRPAGGQRGASSLGDEGAKPCLIAMGRGGAG